MSWKGIGRKPIPDAWRTVPSRPSWGGGNRHATHPFHALLNYGYGVLEGRLTAVVRQSGLHPALGVLHGRGKERASLTFDLMEPFRAVVDGVVLDLVRMRCLSRDDIQLTSTGVCRVRPELARVLVRAVDAAADCAPIALVAREAFLSGICDWEPRSHAEAAAVPTSTGDAVAGQGDQKPQRRSATAPAIYSLEPVARGRLADRPLMTEEFRSAFLGLLDRRGISLTRLATLCDFQIRYWHQVVGNTRYAPAEAALRRAAPHLGYHPGQLTILAGYGLKTPDGGGRAHDRRHTT